MESLLTLTIGEYSAVEIVLRLAVVLMTMTAVLLALSASCVASHLRFPLFLATVALGGAAWFESGVWQSWKEAFELAGTSYTVSGHLIADQDRIVSWSIGVPGILFCFALVQLQWGKKPVYPMECFTVAVLVMALTAPFSVFAVIILLGYAATLLLKKSLLFPEILFALLSILGGLIFAFVHPSLGGGASGELVRGEILRTLLDILSLVIPSWLILIGVLRLSKSK